MSHSASSSSSSIDVPIQHLDLSHLFDTPTESDVDFFTQPITSPPDDFDDFMDSLPDFPVPPTTIPSRPIPLDKESKEWLYSPPYRSTRKLLPRQPKIPSPLYPNSPPHRKNRFNRSPASSSTSAEQLRPRRKRKSFPVFRLEVLLKETKKRMDAKKAAGVDVTEWEKFFERVKNKKERKES
jgi:hypothetical protein